MSNGSLSAADVQTALTNDNQIVPAGFAKIGSYQYAVRLNNASDSVEQMNELPVKTVNGATIYMRDVAHVRDGAPPQSNVVHVNNGRAVLASVFKNGTASTLDVVQGVKDILPLIKSQLPDAFNIDLLDDQSVFVRAAVTGVAREGAIAALLLHRHHRHLDSAGGAVGAGGAMGHRSDAQHHDFGRIGAGGWHSGGRRHRHH